MEAIDSYLVGWKESGGRNLGPIFDLEADAASISRDAEKVARWAVYALDDAMIEVAKVKGATTKDGALHPQVLRLSVIDLPIQVRRRIATWVATGTLDRTPLSRPGMDP